MEKWIDAREQTLYTVLEPQFSNLTSNLLNSLMSLDGQEELNMVEGRFTLAVAKTALIDQLGDRIKTDDEFFLLERRDLTTPIIMSPESLQLFANALFEACPDLCIMSVENLFNNYEDQTSESLQEDLSHLREVFLDKLEIIKYGQ